MRERARREAEMGRAWFRTAAEVVGVWWCRRPKLQLNIPCIAKRDAAGPWWVALRKLWLQGGLQFGEMGWPDDLLKSDGLGKWASKEGEGVHRRGQVRTVSCEACEDGMREGRWRCVVKRTRREGEAAKKGTASQS